MPAKSKTQQRFMGMIRAIQKGELEPPSKEMAEVAKKMKKKDTLEFAATKHKGLPEKVKPKKDKKKKKKKSKSKKKKAELIIELIKIAEALDAMQCVAEADLLDLCLESLIQEE